MIHLKQPTLPSTSSVKNRVTESSPMFPNVSIILRCCVFSGKRLQHVGSLFPYIFSENVAVDTVIPTGQEPAWLFFNFCKTGLNAHEVLILRVSSLFELSSVFIHYYGLPHIYPILEEDTDWPTFSYLQIEGCDSIFSIALRPPTFEYPGFVCLICSYSLVETNLLVSTTPAVYFIYIWCICI